MWSFVSSQGMYPACSPRFAVHQDAEAIYVSDFKNTANKIQCHPACPCLDEDCEEPCQKILDCGHSCSTRCGQTCSCRICVDQARKNGVIYTAFETGPERAEPTYLRMLHQGSSSPIDVDDTVDSGPYLPTANGPKASTATKAQPNHAQKWQAFAKKENQRPSPASLPKLSTLNISATEDSLI